MVRYTIASLVILCSFGWVYCAEEAQGGAAVYIGSTRAITVAGGGGYTAAERADIIQGRATRALSKIRKGQDPEVTAAASRGEQIIKANRIMLLTITDSDRTLHNSTTAGLKRIWVKRLETIYRKVAPFREPKKLPGAPLSDQ